MGNPRQNRFFNRNYVMLIKQTHRTHTTLGNSIYFYSICPTPHKSQEKTEALLKSSKNVWSPWFSWQKKQVKARNWILISFIFFHRFWFLSWSSIRDDTDYVHVGHKPRFSWRETPFKIYFWTWICESYVTYKVI